MYSIITNCQVKLYPELAIAALKSHRDKPLALWHCLRAVNSWGSGVLDLEAAIEALVNTFGYTHRTAFRHLAEGEGHFWTRTYQKGRAVIKIEALKNVCEYLDTYINRRVVTVPAKQFQSLKLRRAWLYASFHQVKGNKKARPISRQSLKETTGVIERTQLRYDRLAGTRKIPTFKVWEVNGQVVPAYHIVESKGRQYRKHWRLGSIYHCQASKAAPGMTKKVAKGLRQSLIRGEACISIPKRFYLSARAIARRAVKDTEAFLLVSQHQRVIQGRVEWLAV